MQNSIPLKPSTNDQVMSWVAHGGELAKVPRKIRSCPFKALRSLREGWPRDNSGHFGLSPLDQLWELVLESPRINLGLI